MYVCVQVVLPTAVLASCVQDCASANPGDRVPDPNNCNQAFICLDSGGMSEVAASCPYDEPYFVETTCDCSATSPLTCTGPTCLTTCNTGTTGHYISDTTDCSLYHECQPGEIIPHVCPVEQPHFDFLGQQCVSSDSVCCIAVTSCSPFCVDAGTQIPDPYDCTMYYLCVVDSTPADQDPNVHASCPPGEIFDGDESVCCQSAPCNETCP